MVICFGLCFSWLVSVGAKQREQESHTSLRGISDHCIDGGGRDPFLSAWAMFQSLKHS